MVLALSSRGVARSCRLGSAVHQLSVHARCVLRPEQQPLPSRCSPPSVSIHGTRRLKAMPLTTAAINSNTAQGSLARAVRPVPIRIISVAKGNSRGAELMASEWADKVRRYAPLTELALKPNPRKAASSDAAVHAEGERVLKALAPGERVVLLDERGRDLTSQAMAQLIAQAGDMSVPGLTFCIGGPYGHSEAVRARADDTVRLSSLVLNHQVANVVLLEQIYRGWTILRGEPYHH